MKTIAFMNYKGGVGKTTLTANVAATLAAAGSRVLCLDVDPQTNLTLSFVTIDDYMKLNDENTTIKNWYSSLLNGNKDGITLGSLIIQPTPVNERIKALHGKGSIDIISSHLELINTDIVLSQFLGGPASPSYQGNFLYLLSSMKRALLGLHSQYDYVLIDCPPNFNLVTQNALLASDYYVVPTRPDFLSTLGIDELYLHVKDLATTYNQYRENYNAQHHGALNFPTVKVAMLGVVFTMVQLWRGQPIAALQTFIAKVKNSGYRVIEPPLKMALGAFSGTAQSGIPAVLHGNDVSDDVKQELKAISQQIQDLAR